MRQGRFEAEHPLTERLDEVGSLLERVRRKGCTLRVAQGQLHYQAPKGSLSADDLRHLRELRMAIIARLGQVPELANVPLSYSQQAHWRMFQLGERRHLRQITAAMHLHGALDVSALRESLQLLVARHETLRTRFTIVDGEPMQQVLDSAAAPLEIDDLRTSRDAHRDAQVHAIIEQHILAPTEIKVGPLWGARLVKLGDEEHVLVIAIEHIISDGYSRNILVGDLWAAYEQLIKRGTASLLPIEMQFSEYARRQSLCERAWLAEHGQYWRKRLDGCRRIRFPEDAVDRADPAACGWGAVSLRIGGELRRGLDAWSRRHRTTLPLAGLTAYVALVMRWCNVSELVIRYQIDGRTTPETENAVGFFAFALHLRIELYETDTFADLLQRVTQEYFNAYTHTDFCQIDARVPRPDISRSTVFNWQSLPRNRCATEFVGDARPLKCTPISFVHPMMRMLEWDAEPAIMLFDTADEITGNVFYPNNRFSAATMQRFAGNLSGCIAALLAQPPIRVKDVVLHEAASNLVQPGRDAG